jgi:TonB family protein
MTTHLTHDPSFISRRTTAILLIVGVHVGLIYLLATGVVHGVAAVIPPLEIKFMPDLPTPAVPPPPLQPNLTPAQVVARDPDLTFDIPQDTNTFGGEIAEQPGSVSEPPTPARVLNRIVGGPGKGFPNSDDYYPDASRRLGEAGVASVRVCVDAYGRLTAEPRVAQSSGSVRLDASALRLARAGSGHYRPTTEDGRPVDACYPLRIRFEIRD